MKTPTKLYKVIGDYSYLFEFPNLETQIILDESQLYSFCFSRNKLSQLYKKETQNNRPKNKLVFTELKNLNNFVEQASKCPIEQHIYLVYTGTNEPNWPRQIQPTQSPFTKNYIIEYLTRTYQIDTSTAEYFYKSCNGRYATICDWSVLLKPGMTLPELFSVIEGSSSCNINLLLKQISNHQPLLELTKLNDGIDTHRAFNYLIVAAEPVLSSLVSIVWNQAKERGTVYVDFIMLIYWLTECIQIRLQQKQQTQENKRKRRVRVRGEQLNKPKTKSKTTNTNNLLKFKPTLIELKTLKALLDCNVLNYP